MSFFWILKSSMSLTSESKSFFTWIKGNQTSWHLKFIKTLYTIYITKCQANTWLNQKSKRLKFSCCTRVRYAYIQNVEWSAYINKLDVVHVRRMSIWGRRNEDGPKKEVKKKKKRRARRDAPSEASRSPGASAVKIAQNSRNSYLLSCAFSDASLNSRQIAYFVVCSLALIKTRARILYEGPRGIYTHRERVINTVGTVKR